MGTHIVRRDVKLWHPGPRAETKDLSVNHTECCDALAAALERFATVLEGADRGAPVPACPPGDLAGLVKHVGGIHRWSGRMVAEGMTRRLSFRDLDLRFPDEPSEIAAWFMSGGEALLDALRNADADQPTWSW